MFILLIYFVDLPFTLQVYHNHCYTCADCHQKLDSSKLTEKDNEIYCKGTCSTIFLVIINNIIIMLPQSTQGMREDAFAFAIEQKRISNYN